MNPPNSYKRIAIDIGTDQKLALINYAAKRGQSVSYVVRKLLEKLLKAEK